VALFGQIIFVIYMILVTLLLVNMLIAMMGHTYETVNESQKEWYRQVRSFIVSSSSWVGLLSSAFW